MKKRLIAFWNYIARPFRRFWKWYMGLYKGPWWKKIVVFVLTCIISVILYCLAVITNFLWLFGESPDIDEIIHPRTAIASEVYTADGQLMGRYFSENRQPVPYDSIAPGFFDALISTEDERFYQHHGVDVMGIFAAIKDAFGGNARGASTITQQLVKNLFLSRKKVLTRKFEEILLVWLIEDQHLISKERMFEIYVNIVEWAPGVIGIGEAAEFYFHKRPYELTMPECIYLATLIRAPKHYAGTLNPDGTLTEVKRNELDFVADRMVIREFMTEGQRANFDSNIKTVIVRNDN